MKVTGKRLLECLGLENIIKVAYYKRSGDWFHLPKVFPAILFDSQGYIVIHNKRELESLSKRERVYIGQEVSLTDGIQNLKDIYLYNKEVLETTHLLSVTT